MTRVRHTRRSGSAVIATSAVGIRPRSRGLDRSQALRALTGGEPVIYALRLPDGTVKIGHSSSLWNRRRCVHPAAEILGFMPGAYEDEQAIHETLAAHRAHGVEYYQPAPAVLAVVNEMRDEFGLPHLAA